MDDLRPDERAETAEFAPTRVGGSRRRGWSPLFILGWVGLLAAVVGLGVLGEQGDTSGPGRIARGPGPTTSPTHAVVASPSPAPSEAPAAVAYTIGGDATGLTITATAVARPVVWVFVSVQSATGASIAWRSLSVADPDGGIRRNRSPVFQTHVPIPAAVLGSAVIIQVDAYDDLGRKLGTARTIIPSIGSEPIRIGTSVVR